MISFLLPTRNRSDKLKILLNSFIETANNTKNYEVILVFDDDDVEHINCFDSIPKNFNYKKIVMKRMGYNNLHEYYNTAALNSSGEWLWVWNDDSKMISKDWDLIIKEYNNKFLILNPWNTRPEDCLYLQKNSLFPIIPKKMIELLGYFSPWNHIDTYWNRLQKGLNLLHNEFRIVHTHDREIDENLKDVVYHQIPFPMDNFIRDRQILKNYLGSIKNEKIV